MIIILLIYLDSVTQLPSLHCAHLWEEQCLFLSQLLHPFTYQILSIQLFLIFFNPSHSPLSIYTALVQAFIIYYFLILEAYFTYLNKKKRLNIKVEKEKRKLRGSIQSNDYIKTLCWDLHTLLSFYPSNNFMSSAVTSGYSVEKLR